MIAVGFRGCAEEYQKSMSQQSNAEIIASTCLLMLTLTCCPNVVMVQFPQDPFTIVRAASSVYRVLYNRV